MRRLRLTGEGQLLTLNQVAERLAVDRTTVYRWMEEGHLPPPIKLGVGKYGALRFFEEDIVEWLKSQASK